LQERHIDLEDPWSGWEDVGTIRLERGVHFDEVVLGIPVAALPDACPSVLAHPDQGARWREMVDHVTTTPTQAAQLWLVPGLEQLGFVPRKWGLPARDAAAGTVTFANPMCSWIDSSLVLPSETWPTGKIPGLLVYTSGVLEPLPVTPPYSDHGYPARAHEG